MVVSQLPHALYLLYCREINEEALEQALSAAVTCTILAAAGPQRSRVLATLYKVNTSIIKQYKNAKFLFAMVKSYINVCGLGLG